MNHRKLDSSLEQRKSPSIFFQDFSRISPGLNSTNKKSQIQFFFGGGVDHSENFEPSNFWINLKKLDPFFGAASWPDF